MLLLETLVRVKYQRVSRLGILLYGTPVGGVSQTVALNLYSAGRPSRWALAHISSCDCNNRVTSLERGTQ